MLVGVFTVCSQNGKAPPLIRTRPSDSTFDLVFVCSFARSPISLFESDLFVRERLTSAPSDTERWLASEARAPIINYVIYDPVLYEDDHAYLGEGPMFDGATSGGVSS